MSVSTTDLANFFDALDGGKGDLDAWLEVNNEAECRAIFKAMISPGVGNAVQQLQDVCHKAAADAGWWSNDATNQNNPLCFSNKIALVHSEVSEALEGDRKSMQDEHLPYRPSREVELADALIRIFDLGGAFGMDLAGALVEKMAYNAKRLDHKAAARNAEGGKAY